VLLHHRTDLGGDPTFSNLLDRVKRSSMGAFAHSETPFAEVVRALKVARSASYTPIYQALLVLEPDTGGSGGGGMTGLAIASVGNSSGDGGAASDVVMNLTTRCLAFECTKLSLPSASI
jgi:non-ribosomal peptide synthetase component F